MNDSSERRRHPRVSLAGKTVRIAPRRLEGVTFVGEIRDLSVSGLRCHIEVSRIPGTDAVVEIDVPRLLTSRRLRFPARLCWSEPDSSTLAFELLAPDGSRELKSLGSFVERARRVRRELLDRRRESDLLIEEALRMAQLSLPQNTGDEPRIVMMTSPLNEEEKSLIASGLAVVLARQGEPVLAVDADLGHPALHRVFDVSLRPGVADWLDAAVGQTEHAAERTFAPEVENLVQEGVGGVRVVAAGCGDALRNPPGRASVSALVRALRKTSYRYVVVNAPAMLVAAEAGLLSELADDVLLVLRAGVSKERHVVEVRGLLERHRANVRGTVLTEHDDIFAPGSERRPVARWSERRAVASAGTSTHRALFPTPPTDSPGHSGLMLPARAMWERDGRTG